MPDSAPEDVRDLNRGNHATPDVEAGRDVSQSPSDTGSSEPEESHLADTRGVLLQALLQGQRKAATTIALEELQKGRSLEDLYVDVFQWVMYEIGRLWEANQITVAEEHMATAIMQYVLSQIYSHIPPPTAARGRMVITGVQGELHQVGANMVADVLEADGWDVRFLGTNLPHDGILKAIEEHRASVVGISTTMVFNVPHVVRLVKDVRHWLASEKPKIILGGGAFRAAPHLWQEIGADGFATDLRQALTLTRERSDTV